PVLGHPGPSDRPARPGAARVVRRRGARLDVRHRVRGTFWAMQAAFPHMRERGGRIINFASMYGMIGNAGTVGYNITKEAVRSLTRTAAREWARYAITANVVAPTAKTDSADEIERADPEGMAGGVAAIPTRAKRD